ncbi:MAG: GNAT family N-acetyltransferase, partial [Flavobacteriaceae bacterium]
YGIMVRRAKIEELAEIMLLSRACAQHMIDRGIYQWNDYYPNAKTFERDINRNELFLLEDSGDIIAIITITPLVDKEYIPVRWITANGSNAYIHRLAVHPEYQSQGFAQQLMSFAEEFAKRENYVSIRLDTFSKNPRNQRFYEKRGYVKLEDIYFPKQSGYPFHCYELVLK